MATPRPISARPTIDAVADSMIIPVIDPDQPLIDRDQKSTFAIIRTWLESLFVKLSGSVMTGALRVPAGTEAAPALGINASDSGLYSDAAGKVQIAVSGEEQVRILNGFLGIGGGFDPTEVLHIRKLGATIPRILIEAEAAMAPLFHTTSNSASASFSFRRTRGTIAAKTPPAQNDLLGYITFQFEDSGIARIAGQIVGTVIAAAPSATDGQGRIDFRLIPAGGNLPLEVMRLEYDTGLSMFGANPVIDQNRHFRLRSYTVATLPSATPAAQMIYVSDGTSNKRLAVSDGTNWRWPDGVIVS